MARFETTVRNQDGSAAAGQVVRLQVLNGGPSNVRVSDGSGFVDLPVDDAFAGAPVLITSEGSAGYGTSAVEGPGVDWLRVPHAPTCTVEITLVPFA